MHFFFLLFTLRISAFLFSTLRRTKWKQSVTLKQQLIIVDGKDHRTNRLRKLFCWRGSYRIAPQADLYVSCFDDPRKSTRMIHFELQFVTKTGRLSVGLSQFECRLYLYIFRTDYVSQAVRKQREKFRYSSVLLSIMLLIPCWNGVSAHSKRLHA